MKIQDDFVRDSNAIMNNNCWLIFECKFLNNHSLQSTINYFFQIPKDVDPKKHLDSRLKTFYSFIVRKPKLHDKFCNTIGR